MTSDRRETIPLADGHRNPRAARRFQSSFRIVPKLRLLVNSELLLLPNMSR